MLNMTLSHSSFWTLDELSAEVAQSLSVDYPGQASGRVREVPDIRTIRYYTTRGLLDPPAQMRGRTALYGERHLLQLVAIKRLQAEGLSLTAIQQRIVGESNAALRRLARIPARRSSAETTEQPSEEQRRTAFWSEAPAPVAESPSTADEADAGQIKSGPNVHSLVGVTLADGVTLLVESCRTLDEQDVEALRSAAAPLLKILRTRRIRQTDN
jgi:DNA-binding transcriptional MerR regulator